MLLVAPAVLVGCAHNRASHRPVSELKLPRIERELNFYVATHPWDATNHFFVYPIGFQHGEPTGAMVYWKEERTMLPYNELEPDAVHDIFAWRGSEVKLDRDTADTQDEIGGSDYLETHRQWADSVTRCISHGKEFCVLRSDAQHLFPGERAEKK